MPRMPEYMSNPLFHLGLGLMSVPNRSLNPRDVSWGPGVNRGMLGYQHSLLYQDELEESRARREIAEARSQLERDKLAQAQQRRDMAVRMAQGLGTPEGAMLAEMAKVPGQSDDVLKRIMEVAQPPAGPENAFDLYMSDPAAAVKLWEAQHAAKPPAGTSVKIVNAPTGYSYVDPDDPGKGVRALPGGPADPAVIGAQATARTTAAEQSRLNTAKSELPKAVKTYEDAFTNPKAGIPGTTEYKLANDAKKNLAVQIAIVESRGAEPNANKIGQVLSRVPDYAGLIDRPQFAPRMEQLKSMLGVGEGGAPSPPGAKGLTDEESQILKKYGVDE